jgi:acetyltransferase-like isoleucine patch superfamily enzyme
MKTPFARYPFPSWIFASKDELCRRLCCALCTPIVRGFLWFHRCRVGHCFTADGLPRIRIQRPGSILIGEHVTLNCRVMSNLAGISQPSILQCISEGRISLGDGSGLSGVILSSRSHISLGQRCNLGVNARVYDHDFHSLNHSHRTDRRTDQSHTKSAAIEIGDDVLVGANVIILKGVTIGSRSIVAAGSVVTKGDYPADSLIGGNPAKVIRQLANP